MLKLKDKGTRTTPTLIAGWVERVNLPEMPHQKFLWKYQCTKNEVFR